MPRQIIGLLAAASLGGLMADALLAGESKDQKAPGAAAAAGDGGTAGSNKAGGPGDDKAGGDPASQAGKSGGEAKFEAGTWKLSSGEPTYRISEDGTLDWATYEGYKRYHAECHTCHGPNALGSTFAPALADTMKEMNYEQFKEMVAKGKTSAEKSMPAFASNPNVMCYLDGIYVYLKARADGSLKAGDDAVKKKVAKSQEVQDAEKECMK